MLLVHVDKNNQLSLELYSRLDSQWSWSFEISSAGHVTLQSRSAVAVVVSVPLCCLSDSVLPSRRIVCCVA